MYGRWCRPRQWGWCHSEHSGLCLCMMPVLNSAQLRPDASVTQRVRDAELVPSVCASRDGSERNAAACSCAKMDCEANNYCVASSPNSCTNVYPDVQHGNLMTILIFNAASQGLEDGVHYLSSSCQLNNHGTTSGNDFGTSHTTVLAGQTLKLCKHPAHQNLRR